MTAKPRYATDDELAELVKSRLTEGKTLKDLAAELGVSYPFLASFVRRAWPHAQPRLVEALGYEPTRRYRRKS